MIRSENDIVSENEIRVTIEKHPSNTGEMNSRNKVIFNIIGVSEDDVKMFRYTSFQAAQDGILFDTKTIPIDIMKQCPFRFITTNLLRKHEYLIDIPETSAEITNIPAIMDLIIQCSVQCEEKEKENPEENVFVCNVEVPNGEIVEMWVHPNEIPNRWTILLPEDY